MTNPSNPQEGVVVSEKLRAMVDNVTEERGSAEYYALLQEIAKLEAENKRYSKCVDALGLLRHRLMITDEFISDALRLPRGWTDLVEALEGSENV